MSSFTQNSAFPLGDDREMFSHCISTSRQQYAPTIGNSPSSDLEWTREPRRGSYMPTSLAPSTSAWPATAFAEPPVAPHVYGEGGWPDNQHAHGAPLEPSFSASSRSGPGWEAAPAVLGQPFPVFQSGFPASQPTLLNWTQAAGLPLQPTSWDLPVRTPAQNGVHSSSVGLDGTRTETSRFQLAAPSLATSHSERGMMQTGRLSSTATPHSVRPSTHGYPVSATASTSRPRGERDLTSTTSMFPCLWSNGGTRCTALIAGDRRSVTSHLRDEHDFACDGQTIVCEWDQCTTWVQRRNVPRHIVACHFEVKVKCERCGMTLCRADANKKHQLACTGST